jgi:hypothetical protein
LKKALAEIRIWLKPFILTLFLPPAKAGVYSKNYYLKKIGEASTSLSLTKVKKKLCASASLRD